jgi:large subunit ribosomal protein L29
MADKKTTKTTPKNRISLSQKLADLRGKDAADLQKVLATAKADLLEAQKSLAANELANPNVIKKMRKEIARIKTVLTEKTAVIADSSTVIASEAPSQAPREATVLRKQSSNKMEEK